ncbi:hypothetical protein Taro_038894 [Colocasia esculenta]|uniref:Uncharacterized protein n=1 Tax=Colocasia esculenta TaxID=4460 RepID=A0A843W4S4_COLES|nr:hypothetical protein [Colocasia esculenta]
MLEALETDPDVEEKLMLYYEKFQRDKEEAEKSVEHQEDAPAKKANSQVSFWEKCTEITGQEDSPNIDIDEVTGQEGNTDGFAEADGLACTSEMNAHESAPLKFDSTNPQQGTLRCIEITDDNILNVEECAEQNSVTKTSSSSIQLNS